jgi:hypothetical protein
MTRRRLIFAATALLLAACAGRQAAHAADEVNRKATPGEWTALGRLPDWSGIWAPDIRDQIRRMTSDPTPWTPAMAKQVQQQEAEERAGRPKGLFADCLPEAMPSWMLINHNPLEILFTPGRVTMLGDSDGNRLRRIYTDGRPMPADPDPSLHGFSVGHWEGETLVIETTGILPQAIIAVSESVGLPNNGGMTVVERIRLTGPDTLQDDLEITAPKVLTRPWNTSRIYYRHRERNFEIREGVCLLGMFQEAEDKDGNAIFAPLPHDAGGAPIPIPNR